MSRNGHPSTDAELGLLGAIMTLGGSTYLTACENVSEADFLDIRVQAVWRVLGKLDEAGSEMDMQSVSREIKRLGMQGDVGDVTAFLLECSEKCISVDVHAAEIADATRRRRVVAAGALMQSRGKLASVPIDEVIGEAEAVLMGEELRNLEFHDSRSGVRMLTDDLQRRFNARGQIQGVPTGIHRFDEMTDGLQYGEQTIIAARPSMGKTAIGINIVEHACLQLGIPTLFVTIEMSVPALLRRLLSSMQGMTMSELRRGQYTEDDFKRMTTFSSRLTKAPLYFISGVGGLNSTKMCAGIRRYVRKHGIKLVVIDYLQKVDAPEKHEKRTYEVGAVSKAIKACAASTGAAFLTLAQLNRESEKDKERSPRLSDLADSGQIERDADTVVLIHRVRGDDSIPPRLIIAKQRDGETGIVRVDFDGRFCKFTNPSS